MNNNILSVFQKNIDNNGSYPNYFYLEKLNLKNFRNHASLSLNLVLPNHLY